MHGHQPDLGPVADQEKDERELEHVWIQLARHFKEFGDVQRRALVPQDPDRGIIGQHRAEQRQRDADRAQDQVFPPRFQPLTFSKERDQECRGERRSLDGHPQHAQTVRHRRRDHGKQKDMKQEEEPAQAPRRNHAPIHVIVEVGPRIH